MPNLFDLLMGRETEGKGPMDMRPTWLQMLAPKDMIGLLPYMGQGDIELPAESQMDPRLVGPDVAGAGAKAFRNANEYAAGQGSPTERLRAAGLKAAGR